MTQTTVHRDALRRVAQESADGLTLVLGGTGRTGRRVTAGLRRGGLRVRSASRSGETAFDWNDPCSWGAALDGVTAAYVCYAPDLAVPGAPQAIRDFVSLARRRGVSRLVLLSGRGEEAARECEQIVMDSGAEWTIVRASWFMQNFSEGEFLEMVRAGALALPVGKVPEPFIDVDDIADVIIAALTETGHAGELYEVTGPRMLTFADAAREIAEATGREVRFAPVSVAEFAEAVARSGAPDDVAWLIGYLFEVVLDGRNAYVCDGVQRALGREPRDFTEFARRIAASGAWEPASANEVA